jgi:hypothetical protein
MKILSYVKLCQKGTPRMVWIPDPPMVDCHFGLDQFMDTFIVSVDFWHFCQMERS